jgi:hypothetical protein
LILLIAGVVGTINGLLYFILSARFASKSDLADALGKVSGRIDGIGADKAEWRRQHDQDHRRLDEALARLAAEIEGMATSKELADVKVSVARVEGSIGEIGAKVDGLAQVLARIETPLNLLLQHQLAAGSGGTS